jgi:hypothetical protein
MQAGRNARQHWPILVLALCAVVIWGTATRLRRVKPPQLPVPAAVAKNSPNPSSLLAEADRFSSLFNWAAAHSQYGRAEEKFEQLGDHRNAAYARIGRLRTEFGTRSYEDIARDLERELQTPVVDHDPRLKLWGFTAKGYTDIEINAPTAKHDWEQVLTLARQLSDKSGKAMARTGLRMMVG